MSRACCIFSPLPPRTSRLHLENLFSFEIFSFSFEVGELFFLVPCIGDEVQRFESGMMIIFMFAFPSGVRLHCRTKPDGRKLHF